MTPEIPPPALVRIDFVSFGSDRVTIDGRVGPAALPFALTCSLPCCLWAVMAASTLHNWATVSREVRLEFRRGPDGPRARLSDGRRLIVLDVRAVSKRHACDLTALPRPGVS